MSVNFLLMSPRSFEIYEPKREACVACNVWTHDLHRVQYKILLLPLQILLQNVFKAICLYHMERSYQKLFKKYKFDVGYLPFKKILNILGPKNWSNQSKIRNMILSMILYVFTKQNKTGSKYHLLKRVANTVHNRWSPLSTRGRLFLFKFICVNNTLYDCIL